MLDLSSLLAKYEKRIKRSWPVILGGVVFVIAISAGLYIAATSGVFRRDGGQVPISEEPTTPTTTASLVPRRLDGVPVPPDEAALQPYAVMVENTPDARPLLGPARANLVIEAPVEGGITRFMLVFDGANTAPQIGPVRSARLYYVDWAAALNAVYAHVGGSPEALARTRAIPGFRDLDEFANSRYFRRSSRLAPHNVYTTMDNLRTAHETKGWEVGQIDESWSYLSAEQATGTGSVNEISIPYGGTFNARWTYNPETNDYTRFQAGVRQRDQDGAEVRASNVIVMRSEQTILDDAGRLRIRTTGRGMAWLYRDGQRFDIMWSRAEGEWIRFETVEGNDVFFRPGMTWISVITSADMAPTAQGE